MPDDHVFESFQIVIVQNLKQFMFSRMILPEYLQDILREDLGIPGGMLNVLMPQEVLDMADAGAVLQ